MRARGYGWGCVFLCVCARVQTCECARDASVCLGMLVTFPTLWLSVTCALKHARARAFTHTHTFT